MQLPSHSKLSDLAAAALSSDKTPGFAQWCDSLKFSLDPGSPRDISQLYRDIFELNEVCLLEINGVTCRYGQGAYVDVYFEHQNKRFKLREERYTLNPGRTIEEFLSGDTSVVSSSHNRPQPHSIGERIKLIAEEPREAAMRALVEELFSSQASNPDVQAKIMDVLSANLLPLTTEPERLVREPDFFGNSYQGLPSILDLHLFEITFNDSMQLPIEIKSGEPQLLYEYIPEEGYLNIFRWDRV